MLASPPPSSCRSCSRRRASLASGLAFLVAQLLDVTVFDRMRRRAWWQAPLVSSMLGSAVDTALFFSIAFYGTEVPWITLGIGDFLWKMAFALAMLLPFRLLMPYLRLGPLNRRRRRPPPG